MSSTRGHLHTERLDLPGGGRTVSIHVPAVPPEAIVYATDGQLVGPWGADLDGLPGLPPTAVVAPHRLDDETDRLHEYSPAFGDRRFAVHARLVVSDLPSWVRARFGWSFAPERTAIHGVSAGGEFALAVGLSHPDVYGAVLCASPGAGFRPPERLTPPLPRTYLVAGRQEPFFAENAARWADALRATDADVAQTTRDGDHGDPFWRDEFPLMVAWAFGTD